MWSEVAPARSVFGGGYVKEEKLCRCEGCRLIREKGLTLAEAVIALNAKDDQLIAQHGWVWHYIIDGPVSAHTHGLPESYGHPDLEILLPLSGKQIGSVLWALVDAIKTGTNFSDLHEETGVLSCPVRFVWGTESGRKVLRVIFSDATGRFPGEARCDEPFSHQLDGIEN